MEWVDPVVKLVTAGGFGALVWYLVIKHMPAERKQFMDQLATQYTQMTELTDRYHETQERLIKCQAELISLIQDLRKEIQRIRDAR